MTIAQHQFIVKTKGRDIINITPPVVAFVAEVHVMTGTCNVFLHHTSASLILCENADPVVRTDLERFMSQLVIDGDPIYEHIDEGPDDMPSHVRSILTTNSIVIPITNGSLALGTWQGVFLWEHRTQEHQRKITITIIGE